MFSQVSIHWQKSCQSREAPKKTLAEKLPLQNVSKSIGPNLQGNSEQKLKKNCVARSVLSIIIG
jgi:hypothetical protein